MEWKEILSHVDHTLLKPEATWEDIRQVVEEGIHYGCASVCIPPAYVQRAAEYAAGRVAICTVIGFPNGYNAAPIKAAEATHAVLSGAAEIDMVVNLGWVKDGLFDQVLAEIQAVKAACQGRVLKVIIETCLLTPGGEAPPVPGGQRRRGGLHQDLHGLFHRRATAQDVALLRQHTAPQVKVKAAGASPPRRTPRRFGPGRGQAGHQPPGEAGKGGGPVKEQREMIRLALVQRAKEARKKAYCPYSGFAVGAALLCADGSVYDGCNIENAGFTATCCAERTAFFRAVNDGKRDFKAIAIAGGRAGEEPTGICAPCGVCRQVMAEFCGPGFEILLTDGHSLQVQTLEELLPLAFGPGNLQ